MTLQACVLIRERWDWEAASHERKPYCVHRQQLTFDLIRRAGVGLLSETRIVLFKLRLGCHKLPRDVGSRTAVPRSQGFCLKSLSVEACSTFVIAYDLRLQAVLFGQLACRTCWDNGSIYVAGRSTWGCKVCHRLSGRVL